MQNDRRERYFQDSSPQQPVYLFPQNRPDYHQPKGYAGTSVEQTVQQAAMDDVKGRRTRRRKRKRIFTLWNLFAVIGVLTVIIQIIRYVIIPLLVYLNVLAGGAL